jgi:hypothetical protein
VKRSIAALIATISLAGLVAVVGSAAPAGADGPISPIYDCTISPPAPGDVSELNDVPIPIDVTDVKDLVAPGGTVDYDVDLQLPSIGDNPGLGLIGVTGLTVSLPRPDDLADVDFTLSGTPNPPLADWVSSVDGNSADVSYVSTYGPGANAFNLIKLQADGDFVYKFNTENPVVAPDVAFEAVTTNALVDSTLQWTVPTITADLLILGNTHDLTCLPEAPSTVIVETDVCGAQAFVDVGIGNQFYCEIDWMVDEEITGGYPPGNIFKPSSAVTRQAMSAFMYRFAGEPVFADPVEPTFADVSASNTFYTEIEWMAAEGITTGTPGSPKPSYKPSSAVTRQSMSAFLFRLNDVLVP